MQVRLMRPDDLDAADRVMRLAFGARRLSDSSSVFGDRDFVRMRFRAAPDFAWIAEVDGEVAGSVFATCWGSFGFFGPLSVHPELWNRGIGSRLLQPVLEAFEDWNLRQAGLFTVADSPKHLGLYQKRGFSPGSLAVLAAKQTEASRTGSYGLVSRERGRAAVLSEIRELTDGVFSGLDVGCEVVAASEQRIGDTVLVRRDGALEGVAVCHCDTASEAGADACYVTFAAVRPGEDSGARFERLLDACEAFAVDSGVSWLAAGINTGRLDAYRRLLARGFRTERTGLSMRLYSDGPHFDTPEHYVIDDLR